MCNFAEKVNFGDFSEQFDLLIALESCFDVIRHLKKVAQAQVPPMPAIIDAEYLVFADGAIGFGAQHLALLEVRHPLPAIVNRDMTENVVLVARQHRDVALPGHVVLCRHFLEAHLRQDACISVGRQDYEADGAASMPHAAHHIADAAAFGFRFGMTYDEIYSLVIAVVVGQMVADKGKSQKDERDFQCFLHCSCLFQILCLDYHVHYYVQLL